MWRPPGDDGVVADTVRERDNCPCLRMTPLERLLAVMRDPSADPARRDRAAIAAAPYCHPRAAETGKKARKAEEAKRASAAWNGDLNLDGLRRR